MGCVCVCTHTAEETRRQGDNLLDNLPTYQPCLPDPTRNTIFALSSGLCTLITCLLCLALLCKQYVRKRVCVRDETTMTWWLGCLSSRNSAPNSFSLSYFSAPSCGNTILFDALVFQVVANTDSVAPTSRIVGVPAQQRRTASVFYLLDGTGSDQNKDGPLK